MSYVGQSLTERKIIARFRDWSECDPIVLHWPTPPEFRGLGDVADDVVANVGRRAIAYHLDRASPCRRRGRCRSIR